MKDTPHPAETKDEFVELRRLLEELENPPEHVARRGFAWLEDVEENEGLELDQRLELEQYFEDCPLGGGRLEETGGDDP